MSVTEEEERGRSYEGDETDTICGVKSGKFKAEEILAWKALLLTWHHQSHLS